MRRSFARAAAVWAALALAGIAAAEPPAREVALLLDDTSAATRTIAASGVASLGGHTIHAFEGVLIVLLPAGSEFRALKLRGVREVALNGVAVRPARGMPGWGIAAWNAIRQAAERPDRRPAADLADEVDALVPPAVTLDAVRAARVGTKRLAPASGGPFGATDLNTSEFLAGAISVNVILVESDGTNEFQTESWSADREDQVVARIAAGLEWVRLQEPRAELRFVYHVLPGRVQPAARTGYEPIRHPADPYGTSGEALWATQ